MSERKDARAMQENTPRRLQPLQSSNCKKNLLPNRNIHIGLLDESVLYFYIVEKLQFWNLFVTAASIKITQMICYLEVRSIHNETLMINVYAIIGSQVVVTETMIYHDEILKVPCYPIEKILVKFMPTIRNLVSTICVAIGEMVGSHNISIHYLLSINYGKR